MKALSRVSARSGSPSPTPLRRVPRASLQACPDDRCSPERCSGHGVALSRFGKATKANAVPQSVERTIGTPGTPLDSGVRRAAEARFGYDFGQVRVHTDERAAVSAADVGSLAYTVGRHVVFGTNMFQPSSATGRTLIHHELVHVVQQSGGDGAPTSIVPAGDASEREADQLAEQTEAFRPIGVRAPASARLYLGKRREQQPRPRRPRHGVRSIRACRMISGSA